MNGSSGICDTRASMSDRERTCAPRTKPPTPVLMLEPSWNHRLFLRSLKNVFQSRCAGGCPDFSTVCVEALDVEAVEAYLIVWYVRAGVKETLRLGRCTRRRCVDELSFVRRGEGELVVVYVQGASSDGCNRQPMAAVRRVGAAPSMLNWSLGRLVERRVMLMG